MPNSRAALRLTELARAQGKHAVTHDRLMLAYWEQALNIGDPDILRRSPQSSGSTDADDAIEGDLYGSEVALATTRAHDAGINAIPAFLLDRRLIVLGAQADEVFERAFAQLAPPPAELPRPRSLPSGAPIRPVARCGRRVS